MKSIEKWIYALCLAFSCIKVSATDDIAEINYLPQTPSASSDVDTYFCSKIKQSEMLSILSLQGIVNRTGGRIYTYNPSDKWILDFYKENGYIKTSKLHRNPYTLLRKYRKYIKGAVIYDPEKNYTVNLATNISGVEDRVIISPEMAVQFKEATGNTDILDIRDLNLNNAVESFIWYRENIYPKQNHRVLSIAKGQTFLYDIYRDYLVEFSIPVFWLPGKNDNDYDPVYEQEILDFMKNTPANIPVIGFWPGVSNTGTVIGYEEYEGVKLAGYYGKFTLVNTWVGNFSYHSGVRPTNKKLEQRSRINHARPQYDPSTKYIALVMTESGDSPAYYMYRGFFPRQWMQVERGQVPISYGITPSIRMLAPAITEYIYRTQSPNDYFFMSISGAGYCYPLEGYCSKTVNRDKNLHEYFSTLTAGNMKAMDMNMLAIYTHPQKKWNESDRKFVNDYIVPIPGLKSIISGMHRTQFTAEDAHEMLSKKVSVHHTMTMWSPDDLYWDNEEYDDIAVDFLENEIKTYGEGSQFIQAMFYSWHYGPRRLLKLKKRLEPQGYRFVNVDELDYLWRQSIHRNKTP